MARPKKEESIRRTSNVMVRFSSIEYELVAGYAKDAGYPISTFVRKPSKNIDGAGTEKSERREDADV